MKLNLIRSMSLGVVALVFASSISANEMLNQEKYFTITSVETTDITELDQAVNAAIETPSEDPTDPIDEIDVILDKIIAIGDKIWKIIEKNKPVVNQKYQAVSMVPEGVKKWQQLEGWQMPKTKVFSMVYKNGFGGKVVEFSYRVVFSYGGSVNGKGQYLSRIEIEPALLNVAWGYKFNANGEVVNPMNAGTKKDPIAATELRMNWAVNTVMKHSEESTRFYVRGDGLFKDLSNGTMYR